MTTISKPSAVATPITRTADDLDGDAKMLKALVKLAADVELFTIPLYMTSLYSIAGIKSQTNGTVVPYIGPSLSYSLQGKASQKAYNIIYSVYIQEMLHLQLALNIGNVLGVKAELVQPNYPPNPDNPNWIPCLGELKHLNPVKYPEFAHVEATLGELNENSINMFMAIELPDEDSLVPAPAVPLACTPEAVATQTFGGIGNLYHIIERYMDFEYPAHEGGSYSLFEHCYTAAASSDIVQVDMFGDVYANMTRAITPGASVQDAYAGVKQMIAAIISEGEGSSRSNNNFVNKDYRPGGDNAIPTDVLWDTYSHWARFEAVKSFYQDVLTWPKWRFERELINPGEGPWLWTDLVTDPLATNTAKHAIGSEEVARQMADAWNTPSIGGQLNDILNSTFNQFLTSINNSWSATQNTFPMAAMKSISSRVTSVWAAGAVPEFAKPASSGSSTSLHACQGLNTEVENGKAPGYCDCATAIAHTCAQTNSCANQGGCGYLLEENGSPVTTSGPSFVPGQNTAALNGGCGAPIPELQVFHADATGTDGNTDVKKGDLVWERARELFCKKNNITNDTLTTSPVRTVLPPS